MLVTSMIIWFNTCGMIQRRACCEAMTYEMNTVAYSQTKARKHLEVIVLSSKGDQGAAAEKERAGLHCLFARDDIVLIFHLSNHYTLVYVLRKQTNRAPTKTDADTARDEEGNGN